MYTVVNEIIPKPVLLNIIFLDIDGVLYIGTVNDLEHSKRVQTPETTRLHPDFSRIDKEQLALMNLFDLSALLGFSKKAVTNLCELCSHYNAKIVFTSSWREKRTLIELTRMFSMLGLSEYIIDCTPIIKWSEREKEIEHWLLNNKDRVQSYIILDDNEFNLPEKFGARFIHCKTLFSNEDLYQKAFHALKIPLSEDGLITKTYVPKTTIALNSPETNVLLVEKTKKNPNRILAQHEVYDVSLVITPAEHHAENKPYKLKIYAFGQALKTDPIPDFYMEESLFFRCSRLMSGRTSELIDGLKELSTHYQDIFNQIAVYLEHAQSLGALVPVYQSPFEQFKEELQFYVSKLKSCQRTDHVWLYIEDRSINYTKTVLSRKLYSLTRQFLEKHQETLTAQEKNAVFEAYIDAWKKGECSLDIKDTHYAARYPGDSYGKYGDSYNILSPMTAGFNLSGVCFDQAYYNFLIFLDVNFNEADFSGACLLYCHFENCLMSHVTTSANTNLCQNHFVTCTLDHNHLIETHLTETVFNHCSIINTQLPEYATLRDCTDVLPSPVLPQSLPGQSIFVEAALPENLINIVFLDIDDVLSLGYSHFHLSLLNDAEIDSVKTTLIAEGQDPRIVNELSKYDITAVVRFSKGAVCNLGGLCDAFNAKIVVSSGWRQNRTLEQMKALFAIHQLSEYILDFTPELNPWKREDEIELWLMEHRKQVKSFVILDDTPFKLRERFGKYFVQCHTLFSDEALFQQAYDVLKQPVKQASLEEFSNSTEMVFNNSSLFRLKLEYDLDIADWMDIIVQHAANNKHLIRLKLNDFPQDNEHFILFLYAVLSELPELYYLDLSGSNCKDITPVLELLNGNTMHIPHLCLDQNPITTQNYLAQWIKNYPKPLKLEWHALLDIGVLDVLNEPSNRVTLCMKQRHLPLPLVDERILVLVSQGVLFVENWTIEKIIEHNFPLTRAGIEQLKDLCPGMDYAKLFKIIKPENLRTLVSKYIDLRWFFRKIINAPDAIEIIETLGIKHIKKVLEVKAGGVSGIRGIPSKFLPFFLFEHQLIKAVTRPRDLNAVLKYTDACDHVLVYEALQDKLHYILKTREDWYEINKSFYSSLIPKISLYDLSRLINDTNFLLTIVSALPLEKRPHFLYILGGDLLRANLHEPKDIVKIIELLPINNRKEYLKIIYPFDINLMRHPHPFQIHRTKKTEIKNQIQLSYVDHRGETGGLHMENPVCLDARYIGKGWKFGRAASGIIYNRVNNVIEHELKDIQHMELIDADEHIFAVASRNSNQWFKYQWVSQHLKLLQVSYAKWHKSESNQRGEHVNCMIPLNRHQWLILSEATNYSNIKGWYLDILHVKEFKCERVCEISAGQYSFVNRMMLLSVDKVLAWDNHPNKKLDVCVINIPLFSVQKIPLPLPFKGREFQLHDISKIENQIVLSIEAKRSFPIYEENACEFYLLECHNSNVEKVYEKLSSAVICKPEPILFVASKHPSGKTKYTFKNQWKDYTLEHYILVTEVLESSQLKKLATILSFFPHSNDDDWPRKFIVFDPLSWEQELVCIAANAFDSKGFTVLGVACEYGASIILIKKLIMLGANLDTPDERMSKLALHWAIGNRLLYFDAKSWGAAAAVQCLLRAGAKTNIACYLGQKPSIYAKTNDNDAVEILFKRHEGQKNSAFKASAICVLTQGFFNPDLNEYVGNFIDNKDIKNLALTSKKIISKTEKALIQVTGLNFFSGAYKPKINVVFMDIRGVLLKRPLEDSLYINPKDMTVYEHLAGKNLMALCREHNAKIVLTTPDKNLVPKALLSRWDLEDFFLGMTPICGKTTADRIQQWLVDTPHNVYNFVVLDTKDDKLSKFYHRQFINTSDAGYFTERYLRKAIKQLEAKPEPALEELILNSQTMT